MRAPFALRRLVPFWLAALLLACGGNSGDDDSGATPPDDDSGDQGSSGQKGGASGGQGTDDGSSGQAGGSSGGQGPGGASSGAAGGSSGAPPSADDGLKNGDETDIDCGGPSAPACADGKGCLESTDCTSFVCTDDLCQAPRPDDLTKNGDETDIDCGGSVAGPCADLKACVLPSDCASGVCTDSICQVPTHSDLVKNGNETDVDCGGPTAPRCDAGRSCAIGNDCDSRFCTDTLCEPRLVGRKDGDETDVDCGGVVAPACDWDRACLVDSDCTSGACRDQICLTAPSCRPHYGGDTCGLGETDRRQWDPPIVHESCCRSLPVPGYTDPREAFAGKAVYLDKYEITAGRMREFLRVIGNGGEPNVKAYMAANRPPRWNPRWEEILPTGNFAGSTHTYTIRNPTLLDDRTHYPGDDVFRPTSSQGTSWWVENGNYTISTSVVRSLAGSHLLPEFRATVSTWTYPDYSASHGMNCSNGAGSYGFSSYYFPPEVLAMYAGGVGKAFTQAQMDQKSLNCATNALFAAFCAWDGGQLATSEVIDHVTSNGARFLGNDGSYCSGSGVPLIIAPDGSQKCFGVYQWPYGGTDYDDSGRLAPPGRVAGDVLRINPGDEPWHDLNGNLAEIVLRPDGTFERRGWGLGWASVQSHHRLQISLPRFKGSAFGARCMRFK